MLINLKKHLEVTSNSDSGMTLVEVLIASALSVIVLTTLMVTAVYTLTSFKAIGNYGDLDRSSRNALDMMGRDIRNATQLLSYATNSIIMSNSDASTFAYTWNTTKTTFTRYFTNGGTTSAMVLLTNCDYLSFNIYQRNPTNAPSGFSGPYFVAASTVSQAKLINVDWRCSRSILGYKRNTESVQTAQIVLRN